MKIRTIVWKIPNWHGCAEPVRCFKGRTPKDLGRRIAFARCAASDTTNEHDAHPSRSLYADSLRWDVRCGVPTGLAGLLPRAVGNGTAYETDKYLAYLCVLFDRMFTWLSTFDIDRSQGGYWSLYGTCVTVSRRRTRGCLNSLTSITFPFSPVGLQSLLFIRLFCICRHWTGFGRRVRLRLTVKHFPSTRAPFSPLVRAEMSCQQGGINREREGEKGWG